MSAICAKVAGIPLVYAEVKVYTPDPKRTNLFRRAKEMGIVLEDYGSKDSESAAEYFADELDDDSYCEPFKTFKNLQEVEVFLLEAQEMLSTGPGMTPVSHKLRRLINWIFSR